MKIFATPLFSDKNTVVRLQRVPRRRPVVFLTALALVFRVLLGKWRGFLNTSLSPSPLLSTPSPFKTELVAVI